MRLSKNELAALEVFQRELRTKFGLIDMRLFGSKARGDATEDSDVDVMVELEQFTPAIESGIDDLIFSLNLAYDTFISATIFSRDELQNGPLSESPLYKAVEREGVRL